MFSMNYVSFSIGGLLERARNPHFFLVLASTITRAQVKPRHDSVLKIATSKWKQLPFLSSVQSLRPFLGIFVPAVIMHKGHLTSYLPMSLGMPLM